MQRSEFSDNVDVLAYDAAVEQVQAILPASMEIHEGDGGGTFVKLPYETPKLVAQGIVDMVWKVVGPHEPDGVRGYIGEISDDDDGSHCIWPSEYEISAKNRYTGRLLREMGSVLYHKVLGSVTGVGAEDDEQTFQTMLAVPGVEDFIFEQLGDIHDGDEGGLTDGFLISVEWGLSDELREAILSVVAE